jgi:hypothetical protein
LNRRPPLLASNSVDNAASDGENILVNLTWVRRTLRTYCGVDAPCGIAVIVGVLVHELTHHIHQDARIPLSNHADRRARERRADVNAGYVLGQLGIDTWHLERVLGDPALCCSLYYDPPWARVAAIREGAALAATC